MEKVTLTLKINGVPKQEVDQCFLLMQKVGRIIGEKIEGSNHIEVDFNQLLKLIGGNETAKLLAMIQSLSCLLSAVANRN